ncbi:uncharacterized protein LOC129227301 isoform X1 [Uloborus diversus]|nr:uncharacterized protein LOC129227301 isoform X1 [Uloborus diversus]
MFRVQENDDGSTSIFCKTTDRLICTIRGQQRGQSVGVSCPIPRPVNVVEPSRKLVEGINSNVEISDEAYVSDSDVKPNVRYLANRAVPRISLPPLLPKEITEDFSDDCITQEQFARCLNLVSTDKFRKEDKKKLRAEFPLRLHSRTEPLFISDDLRDPKFPDDMPLTSCLGMKILQLNCSKNFINDQSISFAIKKYDTFCRFPINTVKVSSCSFPKLRCREKKEYPVCIPQKILKLEVTHKYSYGKRQRQERMLTLKTGLDKRSRKLLKLCQSRTSKVQLEKLTEEQIKKMTERKPQKFPVIEIPQSSLHGYLNNDLSSSDAEIDVVLNSSDDDIEILDPPHISQKYSTNDKGNFQSDNSSFLESKNVSISSSASTSFPATKIFTL